MAIGEEEFAQAERRALERRSGPRAVAARYDPQLGRVVIALSTGAELTFLPQDAQGLERAEPADLEAVEISPSGLGIHFPKLDADLYLPALLQGFFGSAAWTAARMGKTGGQARSAAKQAAARANGRRGGRPRKITAAE